MSNPANKPVPVPTGVLGPATVSTVKLAAWVAACGAVGGMISLILPSMAGVGGWTSFPWWQIPLSPLVGAAAAVIGLFVVTNTDRSDFIRMLSLALLFGLCWKPVLQTAQASIDAKSTRQAYQELFDSAATDGMPTTSPTTSTDAGHAQAERLKAMTRSLSQIPDQAIRERGAQRIAALSSSLLNQGASAESILQIGTASGAFPEGQIIKKDLAAKIKDMHGGLSPDTIATLKEWEKTDAQH